MKTSFRLFFWLLVVSVLVLSGCATMGKMDTRNMDIQIQSIAGAAYQKYQPRIPLREFSIYDEKPDQQFEIVADYIGHETEVVILPRSMNEIMLEIAKEAHKDGADAAYKVSHDIMKVTGRNRNTPVVKMRGVRFAPFK